MASSGGPGEWSEDTVGARAEVRRLIEDAAMLTSAERAVAEFYLSSWPGAAFLNLAAVSQASGVSTATVTRFARRIGFRDFRAFTSWLAARARDELEHPHERLARQDGRRRDPLETAFQRSLTDLHQSLDGLDPENFDHAADLVCDGNRPLVLAAVASGRPLMEHFALLLGYLRGGVHVLPGVDQWPHALADLDPHSVVLAAAYDRDPIAVAGLLQLAHEAGASSIFLTNNHTSPLLSLADVPMVVSTARGLTFGSRVASLCVLEALLEAVVERGGDEARATRDSRSAAIERGFAVLGVHHG